MRVIVLSGPSGSGKSTWAQENYPEAEICSADHYFTNDQGEYNFRPGEIAIAHAMCMNRFLKLLRDPGTIYEIIIDNTNIRQWERMNYVEAARLAGWDVTLVFFVVTRLADVKKCAERNAHGVPVEVVARMALEHERDSPVEHERDSGADYQIVYPQGLIP